MNFKPSEDHEALMNAVETLVSRELALRPVAPVRFEYSQSLRDVVEDAGFFSCISIEELGAVAAADVVMALSRLPFCVEVLASCLIGPLACPGMPGPYALVGEALDQPIRYASVAKTLIRIRGADVQVASLEDGGVEKVESIFAYPMGMLRNPAALVWQPVQEAQPGLLQNLWRVGVAAEIAGSLSAALASVLQHVKDRRQFGRPLGSFQAVQHRLAQCASWVESARWLALKAAGTGLETDAALAAGFAQDMATKVAYDLHQFMGAMGLTLEHPLHRWTYRTKLLRSELAGAAGHFALLADAQWPEQHVEVPA
ncbi:MAG: acyl-CoA dehydrogenase family protein [Pseudomonadota bacterium]